MRMLCQRCDAMQKVQTGVEASEVKEPSGEFCTGIDIAA